MISWNGCRPARQILPWLSAGFAMRLKAPISLRGACLVIRLRSTTGQWRWRLRMAEEHVSAEERAAAMRQVNPVYIPRNHLVEEALAAAAKRADFSPFEELLGVVTKPFDERPNLSRFAAAARPEETVQWTFCGT